MLIVRARHGESVESICRRFNKKVEKEGILEDMRKHEFYESPSLKKKKKRERAQKLALKLQSKLNKD